MGTVLGLALDLIGNLPNYLFISTFMSWGNMSYSSWYHMYNTLRTFLQICCGIDNSEEDRD